MSDMLVTVSNTKTEVTSLKKVVSKVKRGGRFNIRLGTSDRTKRTRTDKSVVSGEDAPDTQPMRMEETSTDELMVLEDQHSVSVDVNDLNDLFTSTQLTQPMEISCEFKPVRGMVGEEEKGDCGSMPKPRPYKQPDYCSRSKAALPPLPPSRQNVRLATKLGQVSGNPENDTNRCGDKREKEDVIENHPVCFANSSKQVRRESNCSRVSSASGVLTKTHEIVCQVQSSAPFVRSDSALQGETQKLAVGLKRRRSRSSLSSLASKRTFSSSSLKTSGHLLAKYRKGWRSQSLVLNSGAKKSPQTPGWSCWQTMCKDLRRRSSKVQLALRKRTGSISSLISLPNFKTNETPKVDRQPNQPSWVKQIGSALRRSRCSNQAKKTKTPLVFETQHEASNVPVSSQCIVADTPMSQAICATSRDAPVPVEHCRFVLPLRRLLPPDLNRSLPTSSTSFSCLNNTGSFRKPSSTRSSQALSASDTTREVVLPNVSNPGSEMVAPSWCSRLHCSACGESLMVSADSFVEQVSTFTGITFEGLDHSLEARDACSISSTYWQAEGSSTVIFDDSYMESLVNTNLPHAIALTTAKRGLCTPTRTNQPTELNTVCKNRTCTKRDLGLQESATAVVPNAATTTPTLLSYNPSSVGEDMLLQTPVGRVQSEFPPPLSVGDASQTTKLASSPVGSNAQLLSAKESGVIDCDQAGGSLVPEALPSDCFEDTPNNMSTFPGTYSSVMQTVDRERLQTECEELAAAVADLEQQLKAHGGEKVTLQSVEEEEAAVQAVHTGEKVSHQKGGGPSGVLGSHVGDLNTQVGPPQVSESMDVIPSSQNDEGEDGAMAMAGEVLSPTQAEVDLTAAGRVESSQPCAGAGPSVVTLTSQLERLVQERGGDWSSSQTPKSSLQEGRSEESVSQLPETNLESQVTGGRRQEPAAAPTTGHLPPPEPPVSSRGLLHPATEQTANTLAVTGSNLSPKEMVYSGGLVGYKPKLPSIHGFELNHSLALLRQFCKFFGANEHTAFLSGRTTHVVMKGQPDRPRVVIRTLKFFMGILNRSWIVNLDWIRQCLAAGVIVDESPFEVEGDTVCGDCHEGPRRSRLRVPALLHHPPTAGDALPPVLSDDQQQRPFTGLWLSAHGSLGLLSVKDFVELARSGGASRVFERPADLAVAAEAHVKSQTLAQKPRAVILTDSQASSLNLTGCKELYKLYGIPVISLDWMLTCISLYRRIPIGPLYRICPTASQAGKTPTFRPPLQSR